MNLNYKLNFIVSTYKEANETKIISKMIEDGFLNQKQAKKCLQLYIAHCRKQIYGRKISSEYILLINLLYGILQKHNNKI